MQGFAFGGDDEEVDVIVCGDNNGEEGWRFACDVEDGAAFDCDGFELTSGEQRVDDVPDARAGGDGREEGFDFFF